MKRKKTMKIQSMTGAFGKYALCLFVPGAAGLISGCQSPPPVREYRVEQHTLCSPCKHACTTFTHSTEIQRNVSMWPVGEKLSGQPYVFTPKAGACPPPLNPPIGNVCTTADQNYPTGPRHLGGGPLYYESQNANWEQAPPFGTW